MKRYITRRLTLAVVGAALAVVGGCSGATTDAGGGVGEIQLNPTALNLRVGANAAIGARIVDGSGQELVGRKIFWSSRDTQIATVDEGGVVTAVAPGATEISASANGVSAVAAVTVLARPLAVLQVDPTSVQLVVGGTRRITARALDDAGGVVPATPAWRSSDTKIATVGGDGTITAVAAGVATVTASADGRSADVAVVVTAVPVASVRVSPSSQTIRIGETVQLSAVPVDAGGQPIAGRAVQWSTPDQTIVSVSSSGQVLGLKEGSANVHATVDGVQATVAITVQKKPVTSIAVSPASSTISVGTTLKLAAVPTAADGAALERAVSYSSDATTIATVSGDGTVTGVAAGTTTIRATSEGVTGTASVKVVAQSSGGGPTPPTVASVQVAPGTATLQRGQSQTFQATARASDGSVITGRAVTWSSSNTSRLTITSTGVATAVADVAATVQVIAQIDGVTGTATVTITRVPVASVSVTPATSNIAVGGTVQLSAVAKDAGGATLDGRTITWSSSDEAVASVDGNGKVTGKQGGTATIRATSEGVIGTAQVTVAAPVVPTTTLRIDPATATIADRIDLRLYVRVGDGPETAVPAGTAGVTWTSSNPQVATVNGSGRVMPKVDGTTIITATYLGATATATIRVDD